MFYLNLQLIDLLFLQILVKLSYVLVYKIVIVIFFRFFWIKNPFDVNSEIITYRFCSVLFGSTSSHFLLMATLDYHFMYNRVNHLREIFPKMFYVDNLISSTNNEKDLFDIYTESNNEFNKAGLSLRMWASNNERLNNIIEKNFENY